MSESASNFRVGLTCAEGSFLAELPTTEEPMSLQSICADYLAKEAKRSFKYWSELNEILMDLPQDVWLLGASSPSRVAIKLKYVHRILAAQIYIIGIAGHVAGFDPAARDIRNSMAPASEFISQHCPEGRNANFRNENIWRKYNAHFNITAKWFEEISYNFLSVLISLREIACSEKLFHFTGDTPYLRLVPTKPDRIGLWLYEMCILFQTTSLFLFIVKRK